MPNGHGGIPRFGSPVILLITLIAAVIFLGNKNMIWSKSIIYALTIMFSWRLAFHLHMWDISSYDGVYEDNVKIQKQRKIYLAGILFYALLISCIITYLIA